MEILGVDIGGSGIKGAPVETQTGEFLEERYRIPTPEKAKPKPVARSVKELVDHFQWSGLIGCGFPAAIRNGHPVTAANVHNDWIGINASELLSKYTGCRVKVINDADAAGLAEMKFGAGSGRMGTVILVTIGTGLGTALFVDGKLMPNAELGHIEIKGKDAEVKATDAARKREKMSWKKWGGYFDRYLLTLEKFFWPDLFILGGGVSKKFEKYKPYLTVQAEVLPAQLLNNAGIVGAALAMDILMEGGRIE
jgi:polyphosphate glucokinase